MRRNNTCPAARQLTRDADRDYGRETMGSVALQRPVTLIAASFKETSR
jgi:hypothetical protein